ncbi:MAG: NAD(P)H-hydrate dehydratase [Alphaproteobacteria bacterium]
MLHAAALLDSEQSLSADRAAINQGNSSEQLMENAGRAVADMISETYSPGPVLVVSGTGHNGGDGFIVARLLKERGWEVTLSVLGDKNYIEGASTNALRRWEESHGHAMLFDGSLTVSQTLIVDALFGTGLNRNLDGVSKDAVEAINDSGLPVVSIDIPSGINGSTGEVMGAAVRATHTVTFVRPKLGHVLLPGKSYTGALHVFDIGISGNNVKPDYFLNSPLLWRDSFVLPTPESNKYSRGHTLVVGADLGHTGASKLAALGALRAGSGLVSVACTPKALPVYAASLTAVMTKNAADLKQLDALVKDEKTTAILAGPGAGTGETTRQQVLQILSHEKPTVLDADALSAFKTTPKTLFGAISGDVVLTPHQGEFDRLFGHKENEELFRFDGLKHERARHAAKYSGAVVVYKGNDTVIASPDGRIAINAEAPVWLATAGSGDVLAGVIAGLMAQGMPAFEAACAGVWIHSRAAASFGPGLIAEDIPSALPAVYSELFG